MSRARGEGRAAYGTLAWAEQGGGLLTPREQLRENAKALATVTAATPGTVRALTGRHRRDASRVAYSAVPVPDSRFARAAAEEARDSVSAPVVEHSLRTYYWGMMLAARDGLAPDPEISYVAAMLHDITWGDRYRDHSPMPCFAARGGQVALGWAARVGYPAERAEVAAEAISLHLNVSVGAEHGDEARVVAGGAGLDVIALRYAELDPASIAEVLARHPRDGWRGELHHFRSEARPGTRAGLMRRLGMLQLARFNAFRD